MMRTACLFSILLLLPPVARGVDGSGDYVYSESDSTFMRLSFQSNGGFQNNGEVTFHISSPTRNGSACGHFVREGETLIMSFPDAIKKYPELKAAFPERKSGKLEGRLFIESDGSLSVEGMWALQFKPAMK